MLLRAQEVYGGICSDVAFSDGEQEMHMIMDVRIDGR